MEEIQENDYVRIQNGLIRKIDAIMTGGIFNLGDFDCTYEYIKKHSKNIIDLIEKDDYINGEKVIDIFNPEFLSFGELPYILTKNNKYEEQDIKTILTKEQYENNCYRIGE